MSALYKKVYVSTNITNCLILFCIFTFALIPEVKAQNLDKNNLVGPGKFILENGQEVEFKTLSKPLRESILPVEYSITGKYKNESLEVSVLDIKEIDILEFSNGPTFTMNVKNREGETFILRYARFRSERGEPTTMLGYATHNPIDDTYENTEMRLKNKPIVDKIIFD